MTVAVTSRTTKRTTTGAAVTRAKGGERLRRCARAACSRTCSSTRTSAPGRPWPASRPTGCSAITPRVATPRRCDDVASNFRGQLLVLQLHVSLRMVTAGSASLDEASELLQATLGCQWRIRRLEELAPPLCWMRCQEARVMSPLITCPLPFHVDDRRRSSTDIDYRRRSSIVVDGR